MTDIKPGPKPPSKRWRLIVAGKVTDYRSERIAYDAVIGHVKAGTRVTVEHWEDGRWQLFERIKPGEDGW